MSNTREKLLTTLRRQLVPQAALPDVIDGPWIQYERPLEKLAEVLQFVGGSCTEVDNIEQVAESLRKYPQFAEAKRVFQPWKACQATSTWPALRIRISWRTSTLLSIPASLRLLRTAPFGLPIRT